MKDIPKFPLFAYAINNSLCYFYIYRKVFLFFLCYFIYEKNNIRILRHSVVFHREFSFFQSHFLSWRKNSTKQYCQQYEQLREKEDIEKRAEKKRNGGRKKVRLRGVIGPALVRFTAVCVDSFFPFLARISHRQL